MFEGMIIGVALGVSVITFGVWVWEAPSKVHTLDQVLPEYKKISEAPTSVSGWSTRAIALEKERRYKAIDRFGNIYLIQNPAVWDFREDPESNGGKVFRQEKKLVLTAADVAAEIKKLSRVKRDEEKNETPSSFSNI